MDGIYLSRISRRGGRGASILIVTLLRLKEGMWKFCTQTKKLTFRKQYTLPADFVRNWARGNCPRVMLCKTLMNMHQNRIDLVKIQQCVKLLVNGVVFWGWSEIGYTVSYRIVARRARRVSQWFEFGI